MVNNEVGTFLTNRLSCLIIHWAKWQIQIIKKKKKSCSSYTLTLWGFCCYSCCCGVFLGFRVGFFCCLFFPCCKTCLLLPCCKTISFFQYPPMCLTFKLLLSVAVSPAGVSSRVLVQPLSHREMLSEFTLSSSLLAALC